jgi:hypothetical protein
MESPINEPSKTWTLDKDFLGMPVMFNLPKNKWEWSFGKSFQVRVQAQHAPCLFHRIMQKWLIGIYWRKVTNE